MNSLTKDVNQERFKCWQTFNITSSPPLRAPRLCSYVADYTKNCSMMSQNISLLLYYLLLEFTRLEINIKGQKFIGNIFRKVLSTMCNDHNKNSQSLKA